MDKIITVTDGVNSFRVSTDLRYSSDEKETAYLDVNGQRYWLSEKGLEELVEALDSALFHFHAEKV